MDKLQALKDIIGRYQSAVIAFSGGVDSTFLARIAADVLGGKLLLVTSTSSTYPRFEFDEARRLALHLGIRHTIIESEELDIPGFAENPPDRCYYCKKELFGHILRIAVSEEREVVFDGSNTDDMQDYRPGRRALKELGIISPLLEAGLSKNEIRDLSGQLGLPTASKPSYACLASRFPYGEMITREKLDRVALAEAKIRENGFTQFRVRSHGDCARLEFITGELDRAWENRDTLEQICKTTGFVFVAIDTRGYRTGAMNEALGT